jgi:hypothetical protein
VLIIGSIGITISVFKLLDSKKISAQWSHQATHLMPAILKVSDPRLRGNKKLKTDWSKEKKANFLTSTIFNQLF